MLTEFKKFVMRGNVMDMAVGIIIGASFGNIVNSLVSDIIMPPVGLMLGKVDFSNLFVVLRDGAVSGPYVSLAAAKDAGAVTLNAGLFVNTLISFTIVAFSVFLVIKMLNRAYEKEPAAVAPTTKDCPYCCSAISLKATKCPNCTSDLN